MLPHPYTRKNGQNPSHVLEKGIRILSFDIYDATNPECIQTTDLMIPKK